MVFIETPSFRCQDTIFYIQQAVQLNTCTKHVRYGPYNYLTGQFFGWARGVQTRIRRRGKAQERLKFQDEGKEEDLNTF